MSEQLQSAVEAAVRSQVADAEVSVVVEGNRALIEVTSDVFADMNRVNRQRTVYACIEDMISDGRLHAVTIRANPRG